MSTCQRRFVIIGLVLIMIGVFGAMQQAGAQVEPFIGEIRWVGFNFAPTGWATCDGQILAISQNTALFSLLGTTYGGDGKTTFALPDLRGRVPLHSGQGPGLSQRTIGEKGGAETVTLTTSQLPAHTHQAVGTSNVATAVSPAAGVWATKTRTPLYGAAGSNANMAAGAIGPTGGNQPHENMPPFLGLTCIIALQGIFPSRN